MRIIAGEYKGTNLISVPGDKTRPTTDFLKEALFSILEDCKGDRVLDLFAGSGALGLEALSRGAESVDFVDNAGRAWATIRKNIEKVHCEGRCRTVRQKVSAFLNAQEEPFDLIFMDPPYSMKWIAPTLELIFDRGLVKDGGRVVVEHSQREPLDERWNDYIAQQKRYGETMLTILSRETEV
jgi:16S rRNA (guanine966-N2)-methyltransferase